MIEIPRAAGAAMLIASLRVVALASLLLFPAGSAGAQGQKPAAEAMSAAKELIVIMRAADRFKTAMPLILQALKPAIVQGRPEVERDYDAVAKQVLDEATGMFGELAELLAGIYASNFTASELRELTAFYRSPIGQKLADRHPAITQQSVVAGQTWGQGLSEHAAPKIIEELRKKGHRI
jgi:uncharacterized protein